MKTNLPTLPTLPKWPVANSSRDFVFFIGSVFLQNVSSRSVMVKAGGAGGGPPKAQSILSTFPRILPSYMGSTASSSQISSNTAPQANSSLAFLK